MPTAISPALSIVIPTPSDTAALEETLLSVLENRPDHCEVVVALGCDYGDPWNLVEEVRFVRAPGRGLVGCTAAGIEASSGSVVHVLAAGWRATPGWTDRPVALLSEDAGVGAVIPLEVSADDQARVVGAGIEVRRGGRRVALERPGRGQARAIGADGRVGARRPRGPVTGPRLEAGFWRGDVVRDDGPGFEGVCGERLADADLAVELSARGLAAVVAEEARVIAGAEKAREGAFRAGLHGERLFWRSLAGRAVVPGLLAHAVEVVRHAVATAPFGTLAMLAGRLWAALEVGAYRPRHRRLLALAERADGGVVEAVGAGDGVDTDGQGTIRIDAGHDVLPRPRRRAVETEPLRKSA